jgi:membrane-bound lytic murein transglycosylase F
VGYDWRVFKAQAMAESSLDPDARSQSGASGLMQLMPSTFAEIQSRNPELLSINDPEWNIAAGIQYDRTLWNLWKEPQSGPERQSFMFGSYNAGRRTILRAQQIAREDSLDFLRWENIEVVAPRVRGWRHQETLGYVRKIDTYLKSLLAGGSR